MSDKNDKCSDCSHIALNLGIITDTKNNCYLNVNEMFDNIEEVNETGSDIEMNKWEGASNPSDSDDINENSKNSCFENTRRSSIPSLDKDLSLVYKDIEYCKLTYDQVKRDVAKFYDKDMIHQYSSAIDIVASYLKGQKIIYME